MACKFAFSQSEPAHGCPKQGERGHDAAALESSLSRQVVAHIHTKFTEVAPACWPKCAERHQWIGHPFTASRWTWFTNFVVVVRDPIARVQSAYTYHLRCPELCHACSKNINDMLPPDLHDLRALDEETSNMIKRNASSLTSAQCHAFGARCLAGRRHSFFLDRVPGQKVLQGGFSGDGFVCGSHFWHNYEYYLSPLLNALAGNGEARVFVIRSEHRIDDYSNLDIIWGGQGVRVNDDVNVRGNLPQTGKELRPDLLAVLCHVLCREIYFYKLILLKASNLFRTDVELSFKELESRCPFAARAPPSIGRHGLNNTLLLERSTLNGSSHDEIGICNYSAVDR